MSLHSWSAIRGSRPGAGGRDSPASADAVVAAKAGRKTPDGYYNVERMLKRVLSANGTVLLCGTCMDARDLDDAALPGGRSLQRDGRVRGGDRRGR